VTHRLAVIAHDNKKVDLVAWVTFNRETLARCPLVATGRVDAVFFFVDPLSAQPHDPDIRALLRVCNVPRAPGDESGHRRSHHRRLRARLLTAPAGREPAARRRLAYTDPP
jgi:methylglyoxal synthase